MAYMYDPDEQLESYNDAAIESTTLWVGVIRRSKVVAVIHMQ